MKTPLEAYEEAVRAKVGVAAVLDHAYEAASVCVSGRLDTGSDRPRIIAQAFWDDEIQETLVRLVVEGEPPEFKADDIRTLGRRLLLLVGDGKELNDE